MEPTAIALVGNLTAAPELRYTASGKPVTSIGIAVNRRRQQADGTTAEQAHFFTLVAWGSLGENAAGALQKGDRVIAYGQLQSRSWETPDGSKRTAVEVVCEALGPDLRFAKRPAGQPSSQGPQSWDEPAF